MQCFRWVAFSICFSSLQHKSGEMCTEDSWVSGCKKVFRNWIGRISLVSCFFPSRKISQSPSSTLVGTGGDYSLRKNSKFVVVNESSEAFALAFMMKGRAGVGGVAGTARLGLGMGRIDSGRVFGHHSESRAVGPIAHSKTKLIERTGHSTKRLNYLVTMKE